MKTNYFLHAELVEKCKANDRSAQLKLYKTYCEGMFAVACRYIKDSDDAEDVLQDAFIRAFQKIDQFKGEVSFGAWLKRIVINKCLDFIKARKQHFVELQESTMRIAEDDDWKVDDGVTMEDIKKAMAQLSDKYRLVVQLYLIEGYDHSEIAQILDLTETGSRTRLLRGKGYLRELLKNKKYGTGY